ncbi:MAG: non-homologous end-joining DNA ligase [Ilumatobacteraceae bacterium]
MLRFPVVPMKAAIGNLPAAADDGKWAYEIKWDGYRTLAFVDGGELRLQSSNSHDVTAKYPELTGLPAAVEAGSAILDGELVVLADDGRPSFEMLQRHETQVAFYAFDVLQVGGVDVIAEPYEARRERLVGLLAPGANWMVPGHRVGDGAALLAATAERGLEGVMAKRLGSVYRPGKRSPDWRKVKNRVRTEVLVGGFTAGAGNRSSTFGSLLVGLPTDDGRLAFAGGVGTGFDQRTLDELTALLRTLATDTCPFDPPPPRTVTAGATWVRPVLQATIEIAEFTNDGLVRHASFIGIRRVPS